MYTAVVIWAALATLISAALAVLHFANRWPLIQIPDRGHRLFIVPRKQKWFVVRILGMSGLPHYRTFIAGGLEQTLMRDGFTVIATPVDDEWNRSLTGTYPFGAISLVANNPEEHALDMLAEVLRMGGEATVILPPDDSLKGKIALLRFPCGFEIAYRLHGKKMGPPVWID